jgi:hypothetical protein
MESLTMKVSNFGIKKNSAVTPTILSDEREINNDSMMTQKHNGNNQTQ